MIIRLMMATSSLMPTMSKQVAAGAFTQYGFKGNLPAGLQGSTGRILSRWGDSGWGKQVAQEKKTGRLSDELVEACAEMVRQRWNPQYRTENSDDLTLQEYSTIVLFRKSKAGSREISH